jgi:aldehyde:ferredoxin oxidoreductase
MSDLYGWAGTVLFVDLTTGETRREPTARYDPAKFLGGVGLNAKIFWDMGCPPVGPFDPENPLMIAVGPLTGVHGPFGRAEVCGIAAQSHPKSLFTYSGIGGKWPSELKFAGYDAVVVTGRAPSPVILDIQDARVEIADARDLWGLDTIETQRVIMQRRRQSSVLAIGQAGETLSPTAVIANETGSTAGQGGFGAVMGAKNLKAIAVRGSGGVRVARPDDYLNLIGRIKEKGQWFTGASNPWAREPLFEGPGAEKIVARYRKKYAGCHGCPYQCLGFYDVPGVGLGKAMCISWWYANVNNEDPVSIWAAAHDAQRLGINHFELYGILWFLRRLWEENLLSENDWCELGLPPISFVTGNQHGAAERESLWTFLGALADGHGILAGGMARALDQIMAKSSDPPAVRALYDPIYPLHGYSQHYFGWLPLALHAALDVRDPGNSTDAYLTFSGNGVDIFSMPREEALARAAVYAEHYGVPHGWSTYAHPQGSLQEAVYEGIERQTFWTICNHSLKNSLPMCNFFCLPDQLFDPPEMDIRIFESQIYSIVTGIDTTVEEMWRTGERIWTLRRAIMIKRESRSREDDTFPDAVFDTIWQDQDPYSHEWLDTQIGREQFEALKDRFYDLVGWDRATGWPTRERLAALDLGDVAAELESIGRLP